MSDEFHHEPVMLQEVLAALMPRAGGRFLDGTIGGAGHAEAVLEASAPDGFLLGCDRDGAAVQAARGRLAQFEGRFEIRQGNYADLAEWVLPGSCDGALLDLGVSSPQLDSPARGFSFMQDGPLDMRMDQQSGLTAADLVNEAPEEELARIFWELGDERNSRRLARAIVHDRRLCRFETTRQLAGLMERLMPRGGKKAHPATKVFMALRLAVNDELGAVRRGLEAIWGLLKPGGRLAVISFHSIEDRLVKEFGRERARDYTFSGEVDIPELRHPRTPGLKLVTRKAMLPGEAEMRSNPRSRSAQLRIFERV